MGEMENHALLLTIAWGLFADIAILAIRILRTKKIPFSYHAVHYTFMSMTALLTFISVGYLIFHWSIPSFEDDDAVGNTHKMIGFIVCLLTLAQIILGIITYTRVRNPLSGDTIRDLKSIHKRNGWTLYALTKTNLFIGAYFFGGEDWHPGLFTYIATLIFCHSAINYCRNRSIQNYTLFIHREYSDSENEEHKKLIQELEQGLPIKEIINRHPDMDWVMYGNKVYDVTGWIHPGGSFILNQVIGREISRFIHGGEALENSKMKPHTHSAHALKLLECFYIGRIKNLESVLMPVEVTDSVLDDSNLSVNNSRLHSSEMSMALLSDIEPAQNEASGHKRWRLVGREDISKTTARFDFKCEYFKVKMFGSGLSWFGRHFIVGFWGQLDPIRTYTQCLALIPEHQQLRNLFYAYFEEIMKGGDGVKPEFQFPAELAEPRDTLSLFIKIYPSAKGFSKALYNLEHKESHFFSIQGPFGRGLEIKEETQGTIYILCAGTGLLPFVDFLNYLLYKTLYDEMKKNKLVGEELDHKLRELGLDFRKSFKKLRVILIGAFSTISEAAGIDIIKKLDEVNKKYKLNIFEADMTTVDSEYIQKVCDMFSVDFLARRVYADANAYYVCGPPRFNRNVPKNLKQIGINKDKIILI